MQQHQHNSSPGRVGYTWWGKGLKGYISFSVLNVALNHLSIRNHSNPGGEISLFSSGHVSESALTSAHPLRKCRWNFETTELGSLALASVSSVHRIDSKRVCFICGEESRRRLANASIPIGKCVLYGSLRHSIQRCYRCHAGLNPRTNLGLLRILPKCRGLSDLGSLKRSEISECTSDNRQFFRRTGRIQDFAELSL